MFRSVSCITMANQTIRLVRTKTDSFIYYRCPWLMPNPQTLWQRIDDSLHCSAQSLFVDILLFSNPRPILDAGDAHVWFACRLSTEKAVHALEGSVVTMEAISLLSNVDGWNYSNMKIFGWTINADEGQSSVTKRQIAKCTELLFTNKTCAFERICPDFIKNY